MSLLSLFSLFSEWDCDPGFVSIISSSSGDTFSGANVTRGCSDRQLQDTCRSSEARDSSVDDRVRTRDSSVLDLTYFEQSDDEPKVCQ